MKDRKKIILKLLIFIFFIIISVIVTVIIILLNKGKTDIHINTNLNVLSDGNIVENSNVLQNNTAINNMLNNIDNENSIENEAILERNRLVKQTGVNTYFLIKTCLQRYYTFENCDVSEDIQPVTEITEEQTDDNWQEKAILNYIDDEVKQKMNLETNNISIMDARLEYPEFCIDEILGQALAQNKELYVVYYRLQGEEDRVSSRVIFVKIDRKNETFSIYPYEYLQINNYTNLKENDSVQIDNVQDIEKNELNLYSMDDFEKNNLTYVVELYEKYKFDLYYDTEHLYNSLNEEYRDQNYYNYEDFYNYIEQNKEELYSDTIERYKSVDIDKGIELISVGKENREYVFDMISLTEYNVRLDGYSTATAEYLNANNLVLTEGKGRYSINRIIKAINDKNYKFAYNKLNEVQKQNYYPTYEDFENYVKNNFFEENEAEILESGKMVSTNLYQYLVRIKDLTAENADRIFTISVFIGEDGDFEFGITR